MENPQAYAPGVETSKFLNLPPKCLLRSERYDHQKAAAGLEYSANNINAQMIWARFHYVRI